MEEEIVIKEVELEPKDKYFTTNIDGFSFAKFPGHTEWDSTSQLAYEDIQKMCFAFKKLIDYLKKNKEVKK